VKRAQVALDWEILAEKEKPKEDLSWLDTLYKFSQASNSWVVHGDHTETGLPMLANDPHLGT
jgi:acyl-homoserine lactone acylase PvdQ